MTKEFFIDSNVFIRLVVEDVKPQLVVARKLIKDIEDEKVIGKVSILVVNEILWILENFYNLDREEFVPKLLKFMSLRNVKVMETKKSLIIRVLEKFEDTRFDFTDIYLSEISTPKTIFSFDKDFKKLFK